MAKARIQVYIDPETKHRLALAAARHAVTITEYCFEAIRQQLAEDDMIEQGLFETPVKQG
jgi:uncharacterized protein (DUF1778 family)